MATVSTPVSSLDSLRSGSTQSGSTQFSSAQSPLALWHLLSLDAPAVAAAWCWWIARAAGIQISISVLIAIALATWILYVSDRLLDGVSGRVRGGVSGREFLRARHLFHLRHWRGFLGGLIAASVCLAGLVLRLDSRIVRAESAVGVFVLLYFVLIHCGVQNAAVAAVGQNSLASRRWFPKELAVGILFAIATAIPTLVLSSSGVMIFPAFHLAVPNALAGALLFAGLCWLNCTAIEVWERRPGEAERSDQDAAARPKSRVAELRDPMLRNARRRVAAGALALAALAGCVAILPGSPATSKIALAVFLSAVLTLALDRNRMRMAPINLRAAVDVVLLTPLLLFPFLR